MNDQINFGSGEFRYRVVADWPRWPANWNVVEVVGVATDSRNRVFVLSRGEHPLTIFDREGNFLGSWGEGLFARPHGITIAPDDSVFCTDDFGHSVRKFTPDGQLLMTLGTHGVPSDTGATSIDYRTIRYVGPPFHFPTNVAIAQNGDLFISDGYGNARIHRFLPDGRLLHSWGQPVRDRENFTFRMASRSTEWGRSTWPIERTADCNFSHPTASFSLSGPTSRGPAKWRSTTTDTSSSPRLATAPACGQALNRRIPAQTGGRVSIFDSQGGLLARWGGGDNPTAPGDFFAPHDIWFDSSGDLYVSEVVRAAYGNVKPQGDDFHTLQKFERLRT